MSITPINRATPEQINHYFGGRAVKKSPKRSVPFVKAMIQSLSDGWRIQLPIYTQATNANGNRYAAKARAREQVDAVMAFLQSHLRTIDRSRIKAIELTRIGPQKLDAHDNLPQAFKHVLDGVCAWIVRGDEFCDADRRRIGKFDNEVLGTGRATCHYEQVTHEDRRLHGIQIRLRLG